MFLKIGSQLTGKNNNVCKYVKEFMKLLFLFYLLSSFKEVGNLYYYVLRKRKKRVLQLSHIMH